MGQWSQDFDTQPQPFVSRKLCSLMRVKSCRKPEASPKMQKGEPSCIGTTKATPAASSRSFHSHPLRRAVAFHISPVAAAGFQKTSYRFRENGSSTASAWRSSELESF